MTFNATAQDADGTIAGYAWDLDGDGEFDDGTAAAAVTSFPIPGTRRVRLRVVDDDGGAATAQKTFSVVNRPPVAAFAVPTVMKQQPVVFTSSSTDPEGRLRSVSWDLDGDGAFDDGRGERVTRIFLTTAKVTVSLRAVDADGGRDTFTVDVIPGNRPPTAAFTPSPGSLLTGDKVRFTAAASDADGGVARLEWDLGAGFAPGQAVAETAYPVPGQYPVRLRVTDTDGAAAIAEQTVHILNRPPVAAFSYAPSLVVKGKPVTFTSGAEDPEGRMAALEWDLDGDGAFDDAAGAVATAAFTTSRRTSVGLRARDRDGGENEVRLSLVPGNRAPSAAFTVAPVAGGLGATFTAAVADADGSVTRVEWDFDDDGGFDDATGGVAFWTFPAPGSHRVAVRATDDDGSSAISVRRGRDPRRRRGRQRRPVRAAPARRRPAPARRGAGGAARAVAGRAHGRDRHAARRAPHRAERQGAAGRAGRRRLRRALLPAPRDRAAHAACHAPPGGVRATAAGRHRARDPRPLRHAHRQVHAHRDPPRQGAGAPGPLPVAGQADPAGVPGLSRRATRPRAARPARAPAP